MKTLKDTFWLWGQTAGTHHINNLYDLPGSSRMTPLEGACYFGIPNMCRVVSMGYPKIPYDQDAMVLDTLDRVVWSIADYGHEGRIEDGDADVEEVIRQARLHKNVVGAVMDDFFVNKEHFAKYPLDQIIKYKKKLNEGTGRNMDMWVVVYTHDFDDSIKPHLSHCDVATMWTWWQKDLEKLDSNLERFKELCGPGKRMLAGCYMWDYGGKRPMSNEMMKFQLDKYYEWLKKGEIEGIVFCSNCIADLGLEAVEITREWIRKVGNEKI